MFDCDTPEWLTCKLIITKLHITTALKVSEDVPASPALTFQDYLSKLTASINHI